MSSRICPGSADTNAVISSHCLTAVLITGGRGLLMIGGRVTPACDVIIPGRAPVAAPGDGGAVTTGDQVTRFRGWRRATVAAGDAGALWISVALSTVTGLLGPVLSSELDDSKENLARCSSSRSDMSGIVRWRTGSGWETLSARVGLLAERGGERGEGEEGRRASLPRGERGEGGEGEDG